MEKNIEIRTKIHEYDFDSNIKDALKNESESKHENIKNCWESWPITYIIHNQEKNNTNKKIKKQAYVGETFNTIRRMNEHLKDKDKSSLTSLACIVSKEYNQSVTIDLESHLILLMQADGFDLLNGNGGHKYHNYFNSAEYKKSFRNVWNQLKRKEIVEGDYDELINSEMFKFSPYKTLDPTQYEIENKVIKQALTNIKNKQEKSIVIEGGAGTGKSVLAIHLLKKLVDLQQKKSLKIGIVVPMKQFRLTLMNVAKNTPGLKENDIISPYELVYSDDEYNKQELDDVYKVSKDDKYDILIVDESHRLSCVNRVHKYYTKAFADGKTQYDWIKECSKVQIFFYDRNQSINTLDDEKIEDEFNKIKEENQYYYELKSQFRCLGGNDYINHIDKILNGKAKNKIDFKGKYEFYLFKDVDEMIKEVQKKDNPKQNIRARNIAGYDWEDLVLNKYKWNSQVSGAWISSKEAVKEIGCIHTVQGHDINYAGVIIGKDLKYEEGKGIYIDYNEYKDKKGKRDLRHDSQKLKKYITNIYKTLLTRGINGTYVYACDEGLRNYLEKVIETYNKE